MRRRSRGSQAIRATGR